MIDLETSKEIPSIYYQLRDKFNVSWDDGIIIADTPKLHCKYDIPPDKLVHEAVHIRRQNEVGRDLWWELYLAKDTFRLEEEVLAYQAEWKFLKKTVPNREIRHKLLIEIATHLSSSIYGNIVDQKEAINLIKQ